MSYAQQENAATVNDRYPIAEVSYDCKFTGSGNYDSIELIDSEDVAGFHHNKDYLNPFKVDDHIKKGELFDISNFTFIPPLFEFDLGKIFNPETGSFQLTIPFTEKIKLPAGEQIEIPFAFPSGIRLLAIILSYAGSNIFIEFCANRKIENHPLIWEQTVIAFNEIEFLV